MTAPDHEAPATHRHHRWWIPVVIVGGVIAIAATIPTVMFLTRTSPGAKNVNTAVSEFRSGSTSIPGGPVPAMRPPAGVYPLAGQGHETISFLHVSQNDGATMPMTITHTNGNCWTLKLDYNAAHWQSYDLCTQKNNVYEHGGKTYQSWNFGATQIANLSTFKCEENIKVARGVKVGATFKRRCTGTNSRVSGTTVTAGTITFLGRDRLTVGGKQIEALHYREVNKISGSQTGEETNEWWWSATDALPLQAKRSATVASASPIGSITYTESGNWKLKSTTPKT